MSRSSYKIKAFFKLKKKKFLQDMELKSNGQNNDTALITLVSMKPFFNSFDSKSNFPWKLQIKVL